MDGHSLSKALRTAGGLYMFCRRGIIITSFIAALCMMMIALYQMGIIKRLPDLPWRRFKSSEIAAVIAAYRPLGLPIPDSLLGVVSYAVTAALAAFAGPQRHQDLPWIVLLMTVKILADATLAGVLWWVQWAWYRAFCMYCLAAAVASFAAVILAVPETWATLRRLWP